ncbi:MAG: hypothetical protein FWD72_02635, partial [Eggerthellaceae bacterium]|nr:hypothetical protein [Eggerthellaceae bacterium]
IVELAPLSDEAVAALLHHALADARGLGGGYALDAEAENAIILMAGGDGRAALSTLELAAEMVGRGTDTPATRKPASGKPASGKLPADKPMTDGPASGKLPVDKPMADEPASGKLPVDKPMAGKPASGKKKLRITEEAVKKAIPHRGISYDKDRDVHYDVISAFIKSMRGSDPDAALYWLARMIEGGEDPKFIARRIFILAAEDIGNADPQALLIAEAAFKSAEVIGYPECRLILAQAAIYMALAPKSNAVVSGIDAAQSDVRKGPARKVPDYLRDRHRPGSENYGDYLYPHSFPGGWVKQQYLPDGLKPGCFYHAGERGWEAFRHEAVARDRLERNAPGD